MDGRSNLRRPLLLGHRGARAISGIAENTFEAFDRCMADGCDGFEFDVRLSGDGGAVVCHDPRVRRKEISRVAADRLSFLPKFEQVLQRYRESAFLDIELKVRGLEKIAEQMLRAHPVKRGFVVSSFLPEVLQTVHAAEGSIPLGLICETRTQLREWARFPVEYLIPHFSLADSKLVAEVQQAGKRILVWTVNDPGEMVHFRDLGVDGIISDDPALLRKTIGREE